MLMDRTVEPGPETVEESSFLVGLVEPPNILFSNPPWLEEKVLRLLPASLTVRSKHRRSGVNRTDKKKTERDLLGRRVIVVVLLFLVF